MAHAEIITIGDELLIGQVVDTNSAWMAQQLNSIGLAVHRMTSVSDTEEAILHAIDEAMRRAEVVFLTGGLGPTNDDITKIALCRFFKSNLRFDEDVFLDVERVFAARGKSVTDVNRKQAEVPEKCTVLRNANGTAPGMWFEKEGHIAVSLPGVPHEMKGMFPAILSQLQARFHLPVIQHRTVLTQGAGESFLAELLKDWEAELPDHLKLAYLPSPGMVRLRVSGSGADAEILKKEIDDAVGRMQWLIDDFIYGFDDDTLESLVGQLLVAKQATLCTAESCTGGYIAHRITSVPGSSRYYVGSVVAYADRIKELMLDIPDALLREHGAVSEAVVREMAEQAARKFSTTYAISCSGIAGPDGATPGKPVGTVWLALTGPNGTVSRKLQLGNHRHRVILETSLHALNTLRKMMVGKHAYDDAGSRKQEAGSRK